MEVSTDNLEALHELYDKRESLLSMIESLSRAQRKIIIIIDGKHVNLPPSLGERIKDIVEEECLAPIQKSIARVNAEIRDTLNETTLSIAAE